MQTVLFQQDSDRNEITALIFWGVHQKKLVTKVFFGDRRMATFAQTQLQYRTLLHCVCAKAIKSKQVKIQVQTKINNKLQRKILRRRQRENAEWQLVLNNTGRNCSILIITQSCCTVDVAVVGCSRKLHRVASYRSIYVFWMINQSVM